MKNQIFEQNRTANCARKLKTATGKRKKKKDKTLTEKRRKRKRNANESWARPISHRCTRRDAQTPQRAVYRVSPARPRKMLRNDFIADVTGALASSRTWRRLAMSF
jgi:hypothetical protein